MPCRAQRLAAALCAAVFFFAPAGAQLLEPRPVWGEQEIGASRVVHHAPGSLPERATFKADLLNLFLVVEAGDHHVTILDGDRFEPIHRFASRGALHGAPQFTPEGRYVLFASRDGWISKFDLWNLKTVAEVRAGLNTRNAAVSSDGKFVAVANYEPHTLVILDAALQLVKILEVRDQATRQSSRVSAVYDAAPRKSFIAALKDVKELWEVSYDPKAPEIAEGLVHDYKLREGSFVAGFLNPRRTPLEDTLDDFFLTQDGRQLIGAARDGGKGHVIHLDVRRRIASLELPGMPHFASAIRWQRDGRTVLASPNLRASVLSVIDVKDWKAVKQIKTLGPGLFLASHEASRYAFLDAVLSREHKDTLQVIDKQSLEIVAHLRPAPGKTLAHVAFDRRGRYALASLQEAEGALIVYDASTLKEVKRLSMQEPVGKYNVFNEINRHRGNSHQP
jgi:hypothetical protein